MGCTNSIQQELLEKAEKRLASMTRECSSYEQLKQAFLAESNQGQGFFLVSAPFSCPLSPKERKEQPRPQPGGAPMCPLCPAGSFCRVPYSRANSRKLAGRALRQCC